MTTFYDAQQNPIEKPSDAKVQWRISAYPAVQNDAGELLVVTPKWSPLWELPGGGVHEEETISEGIIRECYEETGYKIQVEEQKLFFTGESYFYHPYLKTFYHSVLFVYGAKLISPKQDTHIINSLEFDEIEKVEWVPIDNLIREKFHPVIWPAIEKIKLSN